MFKLSEPLIRVPSCDFSFSGLKSGVRRAYAQLASEGTPHPQEVNDLAASFQSTVIRHLTRRIERGMEWCKLNEPQPLRRMVVSGGVASNAAIRSALVNLGAKFDIECFFPPARLCTDNGAMIAWAAVERLRAGHDFDNVDEAKPIPKWPLAQRASAFPTVKQHREVQRLRSRLNDKNYKAETE